MRRSEFIKLVERTRLQPKARNIAFEVLVEEGNVRAVADKYGVTHQRVVAITQSVRRQREKKKRY